MEIYALEKDKDTSVNTNTSKKVWHIILITSLTQKLQKWKIKM